MRIDDNIRGATSEFAEDATGFDMGGGVNIRAENETVVSELIPRFNIRRFVIGENLDADEYSVFFNNDWKQETYGLGLDFSYVRDSTLITEATDTGLQDDVTNRDTVTIQPNATYFIDERTSLQSSFSFTDTSYVNAGNSGLFGYKFLQGTSGVNYLWRPDVTLFASFFVTDFSVEEIDSETRSYGGQAGATWRWDETFDLTGTLGWISSDVTFVTQQLALELIPVPRIVVIESESQAATAGPIASVVIRKMFESGLAKFDYSRQVTPTGRGSQSTADRIALSVIRNLTSDWAATFDGLYEIRTAQTQEINFGGRSQELNRNYVELRGALRYRLTEFWNVELSYRRGRNESANVNSAFLANTNSIYLTVQFNGQTRRLGNGF